MSKTLYPSIYETHDDYEMPESKYHAGYGGTKARHNEPPYPTKDIDESPRPYPTNSEQNQDETYTPSSNFTGEVPPDPKAAVETMFDKLGTVSLFVFAWFVGKMGIPFGWMLFGMFIYMWFLGNQMKGGMKYLARWGRQFYSQQ